MALSFAWLGRGGGRGRGGEEEGSVMWDERGGGRDHTPTHGRGERDHLDNHKQSVWCVVVCGVVGEEREMCVCVSG